MKGGKAGKADDYYEEAYQRFYQEALAEPMPWFPMDSDFPCNEKVRRMGVSGGFELIGKYSILMACLAARKGHSYDLSDEFGWRFLELEMSLCGARLDGDELRALVDSLVEYGLVDSAAYSESGKLYSERMMENAHEYATRVAQNRAKALKMRDSRESKNTR